MSGVEYYQRRELDEIDLAAAAEDPKIRALHENMARKYAQLARQEPGRAMFFSQFSA